MAFDILVTLLDRAQQRAWTIEENFERRRLTSCQYMRGIEAADQHVDDIEQLAADLGFAAEELATAWLTFRAAA